MKLTNWLEIKLEEKQLSMRELARRGNITHSTISDVLSGKRTPTYDFCIAIAKALDESPAMVLDLAGLLPKPPEWEWTPELIEMSHIFDQLPEDGREEILQLGRFKVSKERARRKVKA